MIRYVLCHLYTTNCHLNSSKLYYPDQFLVDDMVVVGYVLDITPHNLPHTSDRIFNACRLISHSTHIRTLSFLSLSHTHTLSLALSLSLTHIPCLSPQGCVAIAMWGVPCFTYANDCSRGLFCAVSMNRKVRSQWEHILSTHPINIPFQPTLSTHPINTSYQHILSTHPINIPF